MPPKIVDELSPDDRAKIGMTSSQAAVWYPTESGLNHEVKMSQQMQEMFTNPADFWASRVTAMKSARDKVAEAFSSMYEELLKQRVGPEDAKARASRYARAIEVALLKEIDEQYPKSINDLAAKMAYARSPQNAAAGFPVVPDGKAPRKSKK